MKSLKSISDDDLMLFIRIMFCLGFLSQNNALRLVLKEDFDIKKSEMFSFLPFKNNSLTQFFIIFHICYDITEHY